MIVQCWECFQKDEDVSSERKKGKQSQKQVKRKILQRNSPYVKDAHSHCIVVASKTKLIIPIWLAIADTKRTNVGIKLFMQK